MQPICNFILSHYATGQTLRRISRGVLVDYCAENAIEPVGYNQVKMWLTLSRYEEEYKEFRKEYALVQKRLLPILIDELREDAEELRFHSVSGKDEIDKIDPRHLDSFRARFAALKFLQSHLRTPRGSNPATQARKIAAKASPAQPVQNPTNPVSEGQIVNRTSQIVNSIGVLSSLPGLGLSLPKLNLQSAEEILGSPILNAYDYSNDQVINIAQDFNAAESCAERMKEVYNFRELSPEKSAQSAPPSPQICEKPFANLSENFAELCEKPELVNPKSKLQYRPIPSFHHYRNSG